MNNEIDNEEFIKNIGCTFYEKIDVDNRNISIEVVLDVVEFLQWSFEDMRTYIVNHPFRGQRILGMKVSRRSLKPLKTTMIPSLTKVSHPKIIG